MLDDVLKALRDNERMTNDVGSQSGEIVLVVKSAERGRNCAGDDPQERIEVKLDRVRRIKALLTSIAVVKLVICKCSVKTL